MLVNFYLNRIHLRFCWWGTQKWSVQVRARLTPWGFRTKTQKMKVYFKIIRAIFEFQPLVRTNFPFQEFKSQISSNLDYSHLVDISKEFRTHRNLCPTVLRFLYQKYKTTAAILQPFRSGGSQRHILTLLKRWHNVGTFCSLYKK